MTSTVQNRIQNIELVPNDDLPSLFCDIATYGDAAAAVYVYDIIKGKGVEITKSMRESLLKLEADKGKTSSTFIIPKTTRRCLSPARRIHKICKGARMSKRSDDASQYIEAAKVWVLAQEPVSVDARSSCNARIKIAKRLAEHLKIKFSVARGVVTSLKRGKVL